MDSTSCRTEEKHFQVWDKTSDTLASPHCPLLKETLSSDKMHSSSPQLSRAPMLFLPRASLWRPSSMFLACVLTSSQDFSTTQGFAN